MYQGKTAKIKVLPEVKVIENNGLKNNILKKAINTVITYRDDIIEEWYKVFPKND